MTEIRHRLARLITSLHILHHHHVVDEAGTISVRNRKEPPTFVTSSLPPILVSSAEDFDEWYVADASPVSENGGRTRASNDPPNAEIFAHSSIYQRYPDVQCVAHIRSVDMLVYGLCDAEGSMLRAVYNEAGFVNEYNPIFDPDECRPVLPPSHPQNLKIDHPILGVALAESLSRSPEANGPEASRLPAHGVGFVRGNGAVVWAAGGIEELVHKCVNLQRNAEIQTASMLQRAGSDLEITYLSLEESIHCQKSIGASVHMSWKAWATEVSRTTLYRNDLQDLVFSESN